MTATSARQTALQAEECAPSRMAWSQTMGLKNSRMGRLLCGEAMLPSAVIIFQIRIPSGRRVRATVVRRRLASNTPALTSVDNLERADSPSLSVFHAGRSYTIAAWFQILRGFPASGKIIIKGGTGVQEPDPPREFGLEYQQCPRPDDCSRHPVTTNHLHYVILDSSDITVAGVHVPTEDFDPEANLGRWQFAMIWHDDATKTAFLQLNNGRFYSTSTAGVTVRDTDTPLRLGGHVTAFDGILDDVMIWNRVLTASERSSVFDRGLACP